MYVVFGILILFAAIYIYIQTPSGKHFVTKKVETYLSKKLKTKFIVGSINYKLPNYFELNNLYVETPQEDSLLYAGQLNVSIALLKLIQGETDIKNVELKNTIAHISRTQKDSNFNFQFILDAFAGNKKPTKVQKDTADLKLNLRKLSLNKVKLYFDDKYGGNTMYANVDTLQLTINTFKPDKLNFEVNNMYANGVKFTSIVSKHAEKKIDTSMSENFLAFKAKDIELKNIYVDFKDTVDYFHYFNNVKLLKISNANVALDKNKVKVKSVALNNSFFAIETKSKSKEHTKVDTAVTLPWYVEVETVELNKNQFKLDNEAISKQIGFDANHIDASNITLLAKNILYTNDSTSALITQLQLKEQSGFMLDTLHANVVYSSHQISAKELFVKTPQSLIQDNLEILFDSLKTIQKYPQQSIVNIHLKESVISFDEVFLLMPSLSQNKNLLNWKHEKISINTNVSGTLAELKIPALKVSTASATNINAKALLTNITDVKKLSFDIDLLPSQFAKRDLAKFVTFSKEAYAKIPNFIALNGSAKGSLNELMSKVKFSGKELLIDFEAKLSHLAEPNKLAYDANIKEINVTKDFVLAFVPKEKIPNTIQLPNKIILTGTALGNMNDVKTNMMLDGSFGKVSVNGFINSFKNPSNATYDLILKTKVFLLGKLLKKDTLLDAVTMQAKIKGTSFDINKMKTKVEATIEQIGFKQYNYQNIEMNATFANGALQSNGSVLDNNLKMQFDANSNSISNPTKLNMYLHLDTAVLHALHFVKDTMNVATDVRVKIDEFSMTHLNANLQIDSTKMFLNGKVIRLDSILAIAKTEANLQTLQILMPFMKLNAEGEYDYSKLAPAIVNYINKFYPIKQSTAQNIPPQNIALQAKIYEHPFIKYFVKELKQYDSITFNAAFNSTKNDSALKLNILAPYIYYQQNKIHQAIVDLNSTSNQINFVAKLDSVQTTSSTFLNTQAEAIVRKDSIIFDAYTKDKNNKDRYAIGVAAGIQKDAYHIHLKEKLILNNQAWTVAPNNIIFYSPMGFYANNFDVATNQSSLHMQSKNAQVESPINVDIKNFSIEDITSVLNQDSALASGVINGNFLLSDFEKKLPSFDGNMKIDNLFVKQNKVGNIEVLANKIDDNTIQAKATLTENNNNLLIDGKYFLNNDTKQFDANVDLKNFNVATIDGFTNGNLKNSTGSIQGNIKVAGKFSEPIWNGKINFKDPTFRLQKFGTVYSLQNQTLTLNYPNIEMDNFIIKDSVNNTLALDGKLTAESMTDFVANMHVKAKDFTVVNTARSTNDLIFGYAGINADVSLKGPIASPSISGSLSLNDETDATLILPQNSSNKDKAISVVRFIDKDTFPLPEKKLFEIVDENAKKINTPLHYNVNVDLSKKASLKIIIDPATGDELQVNGDAKFNVGVDPGGNIMLVGNYNLAKGYYTLHYQFLERQFNLLPESNILFSGNPLDAELDIKADYIAKTAPIDLVGNELGDADSKITNTFNQKIPFKVMLYIKGTLKKLDISFDIKLPEETGALSSNVISTVENKLSQLRADPSAINKQVFSLLVLNRFIGEQSSDFLKGNGGGVEDIARESVSKFLSAALDQIASDLIKGVDIDLNLNSYKDYTSGVEQQKTDLNVGITKRFLDDRLSISLGKDFGVEGNNKSTATQSSTNLSYLPNATINYKLSKDGKYAVRAYSKNKFEVILDGYVVESGMSFIVTMDYEKFNELFGSKKKLSKK